MLPGSQTAFALQHGSVGLYPWGKPIATHGNCTKGRRLGLVFEFAVGGRVERGLVY
jgi:hypothetical protein